jgi:hypothetical protein
MVNGAILPLINADVPSHTGLASYDPCARRYRKSLILSDLRIGDL